MGKTRKVDCPARQDKKTFTDPPSITKSDGIPPVAKKAFERQKSIDESKSVVLSSSEFDRIKSLSTSSGLFVVAEESIRQGSASKQRQEEKAAVAKQKRKEAIEASTSHSREL